MLSILESTNLYELASALSKFNRFDRITSCAYFWNILVLSEKISLVYFSKSLNIPTSRASPRLENYKAIWRICSLFSPNSSYKSTVFTPLYNWDSAMTLSLFSSNFYILASWWIMEPLDKRVTDLPPLKLRRTWAFDTNSIYSISCSY